MSRKWMRVVSLLALSSMFGCAEEPAVTELDSPVVEVADDDGAMDGEQVASHEQAVIFGDAPGPAGCKVDCMDVCNADGSHFSECQKSCHKACHSSPAPISGGGGANQVCLAGNKVWQTICQATPALQLACAFSGGCSGCRKKMDKNC